MNTNDTSNDNSAPLEVMQPSAIMAMEKAAIDIQISTAHAYPRSLELFRKRAMSMATLDSETAESCIYMRPVGKEDGKQKFAEGPSIRLAEIVAVSYGNIRAASKVVEQTERFVKCTGMAHDLESNTAMSADCIESTVTREGHPYSERQRALIAKVCGAKALRDAIFKVVPRALCKPIMDAAKKTASGQDRSLEERRKKAQAWVSSLKISDTRVLAVLGVAGWADVTAEHLVTLTGIKTAMADGDENIDSAFPPVEKTETVNKPKATGQQKMVEEQEKAAKAAAAAPVPKEDKKEEDNVRMDFPPTEKPQDAPDGKAATPTPPEGQTPQAPTEAAAATPATEATAPATATQEPTEPPDPALNAEPGDSDSVASVKLLAQKSGVNWFALRTYLLAKHLMRPDQKNLSELATSKLDGIARNFGKFLPDIKKLPRSAD